MFVCLFDIDGTLINTGGAGRDAMLAAMVAEFAVEQNGDSVETTGRSDRGITSDLFRLHDLEDSEHNWGRFCRTYVRLLKEMLPQRQGEVLPGVAELLAQLSARRDVLVGLLTGNIRDGARAKLDYYQIAQHFDFTIGGFGDRGKDRDSVAREAVQSVHRHLGRTVEGERLLVIGDTPLDIQCARHIGAKSVAVATGFHPHHELAAAAPDVLLEDLSVAQCVLDLLN